MTERALPVTILEPAGIDPDLLDHSLSLRFDLGQFDPRITFTRNSSATYFGSDGLLKTAAANAPRIDYDPVTGECKGFLVEESRTNLLRYSEQFDDAAWAKTRVNLSSAANVAPNGIQAATLVVPTTDFGLHQVSSPSISFGASLPVCGSVYFKAGGYSRLRLRLGQSSGFLTDVVADASTGTIVVGSTANATIIPVGNGWYRFSVFGTTGASNTSVTYQLWVYDNSGSVGAADFAGDGTSGVYIWGAQIEAGTFRTSYIKTEATAATRAADSAVMTGANFSSWYRQDEGTLFAEAGSFAGSDPDNSAAAVGDGGPGNFMHVAISNVGALKRIGGGITTGSAGQLVGANTAINSYLQNGSFYKAALAYKTNDAAWACSIGSSFVSNTTVTLPSGMNRLVIGGFYVELDRLLNGHIKRLAYYPKRISNAKLRALTQ